MYPGELSLTEGLSIVIIIGSCGDDDTTRSMRGRSSRTYVIHPTASYSSSPLPSRSRHVCCCQPVAERLWPALFSECAWARELVFVAAHGAHWQAIGPLLASMRAWWDRPQPLLKPAVLARRTRADMLRLYRLGSVGIEVGRDKELEWQRRGNVEGVALRAVPVVMSLCPANHPRVQSPASLHHSPHYPLPSILSRRLFSDNPSLHVALALDPNLVSAHFASFLSEIFELPALTSGGSAAAPSAPAAPPPAPAARRRAPPAEPHLLGALLTHAARGRELCRPSGSSANAPASPPPLGSDEVDGLGGALHAASEAAALAANLAQVFERAVRPPPSLRLAYTPFAPLAARHMLPPAAAPVRPPPPASPDPEAAFVETLWGAQAPGGWAGARAGVPGPACALLTARATNAGQPHIPVMAALPTAGEVERERAAAVAAGARGSESATGAVEDECEVAAVGARLWAETKTTEDVDAGEEGGDAPAGLAVIVTQQPADAFRRLCVALQSRFPGWDSGREEGGGKGEPTAVGVAGEPLLLCQNTHVVTLPFLVCALSGGAAGGSRASPSGLAAGIARRHVAHPPQLVGRRHLRNLCRGPRFLALLVRSVARLSATRLSAPA